MVWLVRLVDKPEAGSCSTCSYHTRCTTHDNNPNPPNRPPPRSSGDVAARPGVLRLLDEARSAGLAVSVCGAGASKDGVASALGALVGAERAAAVKVVVGEEDLAQEGGQQQQANGAYKVGRLLAWRLLSFGCDSEGPANCFLLSS